MSQDAFVLRLGSVDLSDYLRAAPGEGFDPADASGFLEPQFGTSPFAEGQPNVNTDVTNREMSWPLFLKSYDRDGLNALISTINNEIASNPHLLAEWRDGGNRNSTFYDVTFARLDVDYSYRIAAKNYTKATLHIYCAPPYGHTGTARPLASVAASGIVAVLPIPASSPILGDAPPLLDIFVRTGATGLYPQTGRIVGYAPLPHPSYAGRIPAASIVPLGGAKIFASATGAQDISAITLSDIASTGLGPVSQGVGNARFDLSPASVYAGGRHRILAVTRRPETQGMAITAIDPFGAVMPTAVATTLDWGITDLGAFSVPTDVRMATLSISLRMGTFDAGAIASGLSFSGNDPLALYLSAGTGCLNQIIVVPDDKLRMVVDSKRQAVGFFSGYAVGGVNASTASGAYDTMGNQFTVPGGPLASAMKYSAGVALGNTNVNAGQAIEVIHPPIDDIRVTALFNSDNPINGTGSAAIQFGKVFDGIPSLPYYAGLVRRDSVSIWGYICGASYLLASAAASQPYPYAMRADFQTQGDRISMSVMPKDFPTWQGMASVGATGIATVGPVQRAGRAFAQITGSVSHYIETLIVEKVPSSPIGGSRDGYEFTDTGNVQRQTSASVYNGDVTGMSRGAGLPPRTGSQVAAILAFAAPLEGGSGVDLLDVNVSVRERFQFAR